MFLNRIKNDYAMTVYNRTKAPAAQVLVTGAKWADSLFAWGMMVPKD